MTTLAQIRAKTRAIAQVPDISQLSDSALDTYINNYYLYEFPEELRLLRLEGNYTFYTQPNIDTYDAPQDSVTTFQPPVYCSGQQIMYFQEQDAFYAYWSKNQALQQLSTGDGTVGPYIGTITSVPVLRGSILVADKSGQEYFVDSNSDGVLHGSHGGTGSVDYITGVVSVTYHSALTSGVIINIQDFPYQTARPTSILYFSDKFVLRQVPDQVYPVEIQTYNRPTELLIASDSPELFEWWQLLAIGAATKILEDRMDPEMLGMALQLLDNQMRLVNRKTLVQLMNQSSKTIFNSPRAPNYLNSFPYSA